MSEGGPRYWLYLTYSIPKVTKQEFGKLDLFSRWLVASRSAVLVMTFISGLLGVLFAILYGYYNAFLSILVIVGLVISHAASNLFNDYWDFKEGVDTDNYFRAKYGPQPIVSGLLSEKQLLKWAIITTFIGLVIGGYLVYVRGYLVIVLIALGLLIITLYSGGPFPLKRFGLGEVAVFITWGPLMVGGAYFIVTGVFSWFVVLASLPYALGTTLVIFGKHIDKIKYDSFKKIRTLPVILGEKPARYSTIILLTAMLIITPLFVVLGILPWPTLLVFLTLGTYYKTIKFFNKPRPESPPESYPKEAWPLWFVGSAFIYNRNFGFLFFLGIIVGILLYHLTSFPAFVHI